MDGFGDKSVSNLNAAINRARDIELQRFLFAIGIPEVGEVTAKILARAFGNLDAVRAAPAWKFAIFQVLQCAFLIFHVFK